jgi:hypothetical protein
MTDRSKFEQMLELLINEETDKAKELFHDIVVEKSREIYESLLAEDFSENTMPMDPNAATGGEGELAAPQEGIEDDEFSGDDATDDMMGDIEGDDDMGGDDVTLSGDEVTDLQDRVVDLEDALDSLRDEFESLMGGEEGDMGPEEPEMGMDDEEEELESRMGDDEAGMYGSEEDEGEFQKIGADEAFIREYVEKVTAKMGDNGANTKSTVAKKNDMGGTTANIAKGGDGGKGGTQGGLLNPSTKDLASGNVNVPGGKAGVKHLKNVPAGHGAEKKGSKPDSEKSLLGK